MAKVIITFKIMPDSPEANLENIEKSANELIDKHAGEGDRKVEKQPIAFGLTAVMLTFVMDESKGSTDDLEAEITNLEGVNSVEVTDVRRAIG